MVLNEGWRQTRLVHAWRGGLPASQASGKVRYMLFMLVVLLSPLHRALCKEPAGFTASDRGDSQ